MSLCPCVTVGDYGGQVIDGVLAQVHITIDPLGPLNPPVVISPVPKFITRKDILSN